MYLNISSNFTHFGIFSTDFGECEISIESGEMRQGTDDLLAHWGMLVKEEDVFHVEGNIFAEMQLVKTEEMVKIIKTMKRNN